MRFTALLSLLLLLLAGCAASSKTPEPFPCRIVLEETEGVTADAWSAETQPGEDLTFTLREEDGWRVTGSDYEGSTLTRDAAGQVILTLPAVRYSEAVSLDLQPCNIFLSYHANGGQRLDGEDPDNPVQVPVVPTHPRWNTSLGTDLFCREGFTQTGWNTAPDGSGTAVGLGSRVAPADNLILYAQWSPWTEASFFDTEPLGDGVCVTACRATEETVTVPTSLNGLPVRMIGAEAFVGSPARTVILPDTLWQVEDGAFRDAALEELVLWDNLRDIGDLAFEGCDRLQTLRLNAATPPVYAGTYWATFADKYDRLLSLKDQRKLVLFSGSSTRFGYDSARLDEAFPEYEVANLGVFAYTNALPQLELIRLCMGEGDILLHSPEFDAIQRQFCTTNRLDAPFFNLMEANYDLLALLDLREYELVFTSLDAYLDTRRGMEERTYDLSPSDFDEDGNPVSSPSYNEYGDYILYRPNAADDAPIYGLPVDYTPQGYPKDAFLEPANREYRRFQEMGVRVYLTYAPRNRQAISASSTPEARAALDAYLRENLRVPVISSLEDSLVSGKYLYGTDNHLSTEGVALRTEQIIRDLNAQLSEEGAP